MPRSPQEFYKKMAVNMHNKELGALGEKKAQSYLKRLGWKILETNYKTRFGEVDIIAQKKDVIAFVEVKTRLTDEYGTPSQAVNYERQRRYINAARYYFAGRQINCTVRFDVIEILRDELNHIENAFY